MAVLLWQDIDIEISLLRLFQALEVIGREGLLLSVLISVSIIFFLM